MAHVVIMPKQGQSVESCIVTEFKKKVGDKVAVGDVLFSYETDKASFDEDAKVEGTVLACFFNDNDEIPCLTNVMVIGEPGNRSLNMLLRGPAHLPLRERNQHHLPRARQMRSQSLWLDKAHQPSK